jgi:hypothetical protein
MQKVLTQSGYDFYVGRGHEGRSFYNVIPSSQTAPNAGYYNPEWICRIKGFKNLFKETE